MSAAISFINRGVIGHASNLRAAYEFYRFRGRHGRLYTRSVIKKRPPRLQQIFQSYDPPLFFVTICTLHRRKIDCLDTAPETFRKYALRGVEEFNVGIGR